MTDCFGTNPPACRDDLESGATSIGSYAFFCKSLDTVIMLDDRTMEQEAFRACSDLRKAVLSDTLTNIAYMGFYYCTSYGCTFKPTGTKGPEPSIFTDISIGAWYADEMEYAVNNSLMCGFPNDTFCPSDTHTRAQFSTIMMRFTQE